MSNKQYRNLLGNSIVFTIANLGSKVISFIMVPLYTYVLSTEEYGTLDLMSTFISLLIPVVFLCVSDAVLRYCMDKRYNPKEVMSNSLFIYFGGAILLTIIIPLLGIIYDEFKPYSILFGALFLTNGLMQLCNQYLRASGHIKVFALNGIVYTFSFASLNIYFLVFLHLGINGYLYSMIFANILCIFIAVFNSQIWNVLSFRVYPEIMTRMLKYSIPLIPNALMWWIMDASDKLIITMYLGVGATGMFAIGKKLPTLIDTFHSIFNQAWQISAIQENDSPEAKAFTSKIYQFYFTCMVFVISFLLVVSRPFAVFILNESYRESWQFIPFLLLAVGCSCLSGFLSASLIANEQTTLIFKTTVIGAIFNTFLNFTLIPTIGLNGAAIATFLGFLIVLIIREKILVSENKLSITFNRGLLLLIILCQIVVYYCLPLLPAVIIMLFLDLVLVLIVKETLFEFLKPIIGTIRNKVKKNG